MDIDLNATAICLFRPFLFLHLQKKQGNSLGYYMGAFLLVLTPKASLLI